MKNCISVLLLFSVTVTLTAQQKFSLQQCIEQGLKGNLNILQAEVNQQLASVNYLQSRASILPSINAGASHTYNIGRAIDRYTNTFANNNVLSQNFYIGTQLTLWSGLSQYNTIKQNQFNHLASKENLEQRKNDLALSIASSFLQVMYSNEFLKVADNQRKISQEQTERIQKLVDAGALAQTNLLDFKAQLANDEYNFVASENNTIAAILALKQLINLDTVSDFEIATPEFPEPQHTILNLTVRDIYEKALGNQHSIKSAEYGVIASEKTLSVAKGRISPTLTLNGSLGTGYSGLAKRIKSYTGTGFYSIYATSNGLTVVNPEELKIPVLEETPFADQFKDNVNKSIGISLNVPLFNGLGNYSSVKNAQLQQLNSKYNYDLAKQQLFKAISQAFNDAQSSYSKYIAALSAQTAAEKSFNFNKQKFEVGSIGAVDFNAAKNRLLNAQSDVLNSKFDYIFKLKVIDFYQGKSLY